MPGLAGIPPEAVAQKDTEPVLPGNVVAACEVEVDPVIEVAPADDEAGPPAPSPTVPKPLVPSPAVPRPDVAVEETVAVAVVVPEEPFVALHGADVPVAASIKLTLLACATAELAVAVVTVAPGVAVEPGVAIAPRLRPPPSNVGSVAVPVLADEHAVEFASPDWPVALCDMPAPTRPDDCSGEVACRPGSGGMLVCATLVLMPSPASAMARARKPLIRICDLQEFKAAFGWPGRSIGARSSQN